ncbi:hypothetical protein [Clostridium botulinum]|uniref:hypothetical protein n=1 Tax=Clostridium botulinum TaxID=1491 RepID=UPI000947A9B4|nr:hypothetical protein [Clostridium botulinum]MBN3354028.1 hypothetical protein [Clostridium botulinum]QDY29428.1 hypothetical protein CGQ41_11700 [Clostridium botulinum]
MKFNWNEFKKGKIAVCCDTREKAINFLSECNLNNIKWADGERIIPTQCFIDDFEEYKNGICYRFVNDFYSYGLAHDEIDYYNNHDFYKIIEWKIENKIDYDKEYSIHEVMEFPEETIFKCGNCEYRVKDGELEWLDEDIWKLNLMTLKQTLALKFKVLKKDKKVEFIEAVKAFTKGKTIKVQYKNIIEIYEPEEFNGEYILTDGDTLIPEEILYGEWYIKEE